MADKKPSRSFRRTLSNNWFALKWLFRCSKFYVLFSILCSIISEIVAMLEHTFLVAYIIDCIQYSRPFTDVLAALLPLTGLIILNMTLFAYINTNIIPKKVEKVDRDMRLTLYEKAAGMDIAHYDDPQFYNDFVWAMQEAPGHVHGVLQTLNMLSGTVALVLCMGAYMITADPAGLLFVGVSLGLTFFLRLRLNKRYMAMEEEKRPSQRKRDYINRLFYLTDYAKDLRMGEMKEKLYDDFKASSEAMEHTVKAHSKRLWLLGFLAQIFQNVLSFDGLYLTYLLFKTLVLGAFGYGTMVALYNASSRLQDNLQDLTQILPDFQQHSLYIEKMRRFLEAENTLSDTGTAALPHGGELILEHVDFTYPQASAPTLHDISLHIPKGAKVALVGYNGAGKSTLVKLLMRLYDPTAGRLLYDGRPLSDYPLAAYRAQVGTVFQDYQMMAATLGENITMSTAPIDTDKAAKVLADVSFTDRMTTLSRGLDTPLTKEFEDDGINLSGGEAQKIAIARVLYSDASLLILDEPSSALDPLSEYRLNQTMRELAADKTVIFISHRLSTTRMADCIFMLENGRIIERGSHDELMARGGKYAEMFLLQAKKYR